MAEQIISPGVFTRENDLSFLPQGIGAIGAAIVGPTEKGPAFVPTVLTRGYSEYVARFGASSDACPTYVPMTVRNYLRNAGTVTIVRVLGGGGYKFTNAGGLQAIVDSNNKINIVLHPSKNANASNGATGHDLHQTGTGEATVTTFTSQQDPLLGHIIFSGSNFSSQSFSCSMDTNASTYIGRVLGNSPENSKTGAGVYASSSAYCYVEMKNHIASQSGVTQTVTAIPAAKSIFTSSNAEGYDHAKTPFIQSGFLNAGGTVQNLFRIHVIADGTICNKDYKVAIDGVKQPADIDGIEQFSTFNLKLRKYGDKDNAPVIIEQYNNCNLNPNSPNYIANLIGDRFARWDDTLQKVLTFGNFANKSQYIRVEMDPMVDAGSISPKLSPRGFDVVQDSINIDDTKRMPGVVYWENQTLQNPTASASNTFNKKRYLGWDFEFNKDHENWNMPIPNSTVANSTGKFNVDSLHGHPSASYVGSLSASVDILGASGPQSHQIQFVVPFQGGFDGSNPSLLKLNGAQITAGNMQGLNLTDSSKTGFKAYKKALDILSNQDEYDFNLLALPGVLNRLHSSVTDVATTMVEDRGDAFYVMDLGSETDSVATAVNQAAGLDSNYAAVYYPWVKILDTTTNRPVFVPPSVVVPGAIAQSDAAAAEWFAPAGLNRGVLGNVLEAKIRLNQTERDQLYDGKVNPIATFPRTGVCIWGQKTTQTRSTALDRINVRRLLIEVKKFIASSSKYLVFEQNTLQTRNRFLNIVNPYLESVQQRQGLFAFRVQMDENNNTPDVVDRNQLVGGIFLQPTKTAEFIILDFNILPTGATFDGGTVTGGSGGSGGGGGY